jgi:hypothetical protein
MRAMNCSNESCKRDWESIEAIGLEPFHCDLCDVVVIASNVFQCARCGGNYCTRCKSRSTIITCTKCVPNRPLDFTFYATPEQCAPTALDNEHNQCPLNLQSCNRQKSRNLWHCNICHEYEAYMIGGTCYKCNEWRCCFGDFICLSCIDAGHPDQEQYIM